MVVKNCVWHRRCLENLTESHRFWTAASSPRVLLRNWQGRAESHSAWSKTQMATLKRKKGYHLSHGLGRLNNKHVMRKCVLNGVLIDKNHTEHLQPCEIHKPIAFICLPSETQVEGQAISIEEFTYPRQQGHGLPGFQKCVHSCLLLMLIASYCILQPS